jgi:ACS family tartrate transporter-like MFS transporter
VAVLVQSDSSEAALLSRVRRRLIPFMFLLYIAAYLDRVNIGFAALQMNRDLGLSDAVYGFGAGIFFLSYFVFEVPSNLIMARVGARAWIARIMITWGIISSSMMFVRGPASFYTLRFLLGIAEAGFFPGMILYLTYWFPSRERGSAISLFMTAIALAGVIGGPVSGALLSLHNVGGLAGWQWLFLLEGIPSVVLGLVVLWYLPNGPNDARWLSAEEKKFLLARLETSKPAEAAAHASTLRGALGNPRVWGFGFCYFGVVIGLYGLTFWLPTIIKGLSNLSDFTIGLLSALPYIVAAIGMVLVGRHSDATGERRWHVAGSAFIAAVGFLLSATTDSPVLKLTSFSVAAFGIFAAMPTFWTMPTAMLTGTGAAAGIAVINSIGNLGGFVGPYLIGLIRTATGTFVAPMIAMAAALVFGGVLALISSAPSGTAATRAREATRIRDEVLPADKN